MEEKFKELAFKCFTDYECVGCTKSGVTFTKNNCSINLYFEKFYDGKYNDIEKLAVKVTRYGKEEYDKETNKYIQTRNAVTYYSLYELTEEEIVKFKYLLQECYNKYSEYVLSEIS